MIYRILLQIWLKVDSKGPIDNRLVKHQRPVTRSFDVFFDLRLNKRLSKQ